MAFVFPQNPSVGEVVTNPASGQSFQWTGYAWAGASFNTPLTASYALTASVVLGAIASASNSISASFSDTAATASYIQLDAIAYSGNYGHDEAAAAAGVPIGGLYRNGNFMQIRIS
jgi:hypothetical protein